MIALDGSQGEGGGQILRSALALSLCTGAPFRIDNIRAGRPRPGLMRQHLTAVLAATQVGNAETTGAAVGSRNLTFKPGKPRAGEATLHHRRSSDRGAIAALGRGASPARGLQALAN